MNSQLIILSIVAVLLSGCGGGNGTDDNNTPPSTANEPLRFVCTKDSRCPEILINGDPHSQLAGANAPFRGYGDPSLAYDALNNTLWLSYSYLDILINDSGPPANINLGVRTHLAKSTNGGATFEFVTPINNTAATQHPTTLEQGWLIHEVPTINQQRNGDWQLLWLQYFNTLPQVAAGPTTRSDFLFVQSRASGPEQLGLITTTNAAANITSTAFGSFFNLNDIPEIADCTVFTEPALFSDALGDYLVAQCIVISNGIRQSHQDRLFLLEQTNTGYRFIAQLTDATDAQQFDADVLTQADVAFARDDSIILIMTPKRLNADPQHQGCVIVTFSDFSAGELQRNNNGRLTERVVITAEGNGLGPGLCSYDPESDTGVLLVITTVAENDVEFSLRKTGIHP